MAKKKEVAKSPLPKVVKATKVLDFPMAMAEVINGKRVRRNEWPEGVYGELSNGMLCINLNDGIHTWMVSEADLYAEDYETTY